MKPGFLLLAVAASLFGCVALRHRNRQAAPGPRLYVLDCGDIKPMDPTLFGLKKEEIAGDAHFVTPCYLIVHPKGTLMWDVGQVPDAKIPDDGTEVVVQDLLKAQRKLLPQLEGTGLRAEATSPTWRCRTTTWITRRTPTCSPAPPGSCSRPSTTRCSAARSSPSATPATYDKLKDSKRITLNNEDHDVFGDGTVIIKTAPGHTPGHQMLFLRLKKFGPLLLAGDLYHLPEERTLDRVPTFDFDAAMTRATRVKTETFLKETGAEMWIQHDPTTYAKLRKAPQYYD